MPPSSSLPSAADALSALNSYQAPSSADVLSQADSKYGVNDLQQKVSALQSLTGNLTNAIAAVDPSVTARTAGSLTTEGQRSALVNREQAPITAQLGTANTALGQTTNNFNTANQNAKDAANMTIADNTAKQQQLLQTYQIAQAREDAAAQLAAQQAAQAEQIRQYNESQAYTQANDAANRAASAAASANSSSGGTPTVAAQQSQVAQHVVGQFNSLKGGDGKVSEETWQNALNDWTATGGSVRTFWQNYGNYVNNKYIKTYAGYAAR